MQARAFPPVHTVVRCHPSLRAGFAARTRRFTQDDKVDRDDT